MRKRRSRWLWWMRNVRGSLWLVAIASVATASVAAPDAHAQRADALNAGVKIRGQLNVGTHDPLVATFARRDSVTFVYKTIGNELQQTRQFADVASLEGAAKTRTLGQAWKRGSIIGGIAGLVVSGAAIAVGGYYDNHDTCNCVRLRAATAYLLAPAFTAGTAATGGWISARRFEHRQRDELLSR